MEVSVKRKEEEVWKEKKRSERRLCVDRDFFRIFFNKGGGSKKGCITFLCACFFVDTEILLYGS